MPHRPTSPQQLRHALSRRRIRRRSRRLGAVAACALGATLALSGTAHAGPAGHGAKFAGRYVALGDSYAAGPGIPHLRLESGLCARSTNNYPSQVAAALAPAAFRDMSCTGAETKHMTKRQHSNPPQFSALGPDTRLVTLTIGGNDAGFIEVLATCAIVGVLDPGGAPCEKKNTLGGSDKIDRRIDETMPKIAEVIRGIRERAPQAAVFAVGYPALLPDSKDSCVVNIPLARGDVPYLAAKIRRFNERLAAVAAENGAIYVDTYTPSVGRDGCQAADVRWIEGIEDVRGAIPVHPNARGMAGIAEVVLAAIRAVNLAGV